MAKAERLIWKRISNYRPTWEATYGGKTYRLEKNTERGMGDWHMWVYIPEADRQNVFGTPTGSAWDTVKPLPGKAYVTMSFGSTERKAKHNARLLLVEGLDAESDRWED